MRAGLKCLEITRQGAGPGFLLWFRGGVGVRVSAHGPGPHVV